MIGAQGAMSSETEETSSLTYELSCTDCSYEATVDGSVHDALDTAQAHREEHGSTYGGHFVDFELIDNTE